MSEKIERVELHLHTKMSQMDGLISPEAAIIRAKEWGHKAIAFTDHGTVEAYPEIASAAKKHGIKPIYGLEAYVVNDLESSVKGSYSGTFDDEIVAFDVETTGLSVCKDSIIEIAAVKVCRGQIIDRFHSYVNPEFRIPEQITEWTGITDETVRNAPSIDVALRLFSDFIGDRLLIATDADFGIAFIKQAAKLCDISFGNPSMNLSSLFDWLHPEQNHHRPKDMAEFYGEKDYSLSDANGYAETNVKLFWCIIEELRGKEISNFAELNRNFSLTRNYARLPRYHQTILVKNQTGLKNLYRLVTLSNLDYFHRVPILPLSILNEHREGLLIGSACSDGLLYKMLLDEASEEEIEKLIHLCDYLEIQPVSNNRWLLKAEQVYDDEELRDINQRIVELGEKYGKPVVATCDARYLDKDDAVCRQLLLREHHFVDWEDTYELYFRSTAEMLEEFSYLGKDKAYEVVVTNTNKIADMIETVTPIPDENYFPHMDGENDELKKKCFQKAHEIYGTTLPDFVSNRLDEELSIVLVNDYAVHYMIAERIVAFCRSKGYPTTSRGAVGASFVAYLLGITDINPLEPHYLCPKCKHTEVSTEGSGATLSKRNCPVCTTAMCTDGHKIPFEVFLGFFGDRYPDIDINVSPAIQGEVIDYLKDLFGRNRVFAVGTTHILPEKTALAMLRKYCDETGVEFGKEETERIIQTCTGVKRSNGVHPGGLFILPEEHVIEDSSPLQYMDDDQPVSVTQMPFSALQNQLLKVDLLCYLIPEKIKYLSEHTSVDFEEVPLDDKKVYELFARADTDGIPEFSTPFMKDILTMTKPRNFYEVLKINGLTHGTNTWKDNAEPLLAKGTCKLTDTVAFRDDIMLDLIAYGMDRKDAFFIMEHVRKGKGMTSEQEEMMRAFSVPDWYIESCKKILYLFPKAHAVSYTIVAVRFAWYKVYYPQIFKQMMGEFE